MVPQVGSPTGYLPDWKVLPLEGAHTHQWSPQTQAPQRGGERAERELRNLLVSSTEGHFGPSEKLLTFPGEAQGDP